MRYKLTRTYVGGATWTTFYNFKWTALLAYERARVEDTQVRAMTVHRRSDGKLLRIML
jgi:hypothetical protein